MGDFGRRGCLGCLVILGLMLLCGTITFFSIDTICYSGLTRRMPIYPGAQVVSTSHNLARDYGMGVTVLVLDSPDDPATVQSWYARNTGTYLREMLQSDNPMDGVVRTMSQSTFQVLDNGAGGSQIILYGTCAN